MKRLLHTQFLTPALFLFSLLGPLPTFGEPWLATRFAQNCAGCHAPGRYNLEPKDRRCTLSCQGCHTNPNGGGMRNFYGKWSSDRWLRSTSPKWQGSAKEQPLPWFAQNYISETQVRKVIASLEAWGTKTKTAHPLNKKSVPKSKSDRQTLINAMKATKSARKKKSRYVLTSRDYPRSSFSEAYYERDNGDNNWDITATSDKMYESTIPANDPYFLKKKREVLVGLDFRYFGRNAIDSENEDIFWPMNLDVGLQYKPFIKWLDNFSLVVETRYFNPPLDSTGGKNSDIELTTTSSVTNRATYLLVDDLIFNSFVMYGNYKPMFEHYTPDHTTLAQNILYGRSAYNVVNKTMSIGLAPNVPFANFHLIQPMVNDANQEDGYVANIGARWVTLGASIVLSYRSVTDKKTGLDTTAYSLSGGAKYKNLILNGETLNITREFTPGSSDSGSIITVEARYKVWRESYLEYVVEASNITAGINGQTALKEGSANQMTVGYKIFPMAGMDYSINYRRTESRPKSADKFEATEALLQAHLYF